MKHAIHMRKYDKNKLIKVKIFIKNWDGICYVLEERYTNW